LEIELREKEVKNKARRYKKERIREEVPGGKSRNLT
jgi:hypothetical protein